MNGSELPSAQRKAADGPSRTGLAALQDLAEHRKCPAISRDAAFVIVWSIRISARLINYQRDRVCRLHDCTIARLRYSHDYGNSMVAVKAAEDSRTPRPGGGNLVMY